MTDTTDALPANHQLAHSDRALPAGAIGYRASGWWGACFLVLSEAAIFAYLFFAYFYYSVQPQGVWVPGHHVDLTYSAPQLAVMVLGSAAAWWSSRSALRGERLPLLLALGTMILLSAAYIALAFADWFSKPYGFADSPYTSIYFVISGFHLAHVAVGFLAFVMVLLWTLLGYFDAVRHLPVTVAALYWYFLAVVYIAVFFVLYVTPYLT
jgi:cytochrome c oxidase subunit 3